MNKINTSRFEGFDYFFWFGLQIQIRVLSIFLCMSYKYRSSVSDFCYHYAGPKGRKRERGPLGALGPKWGRLPCK